MAIRLKPLAEQVMVITGASSGIGRTTARLAAARGARVALAGRSEDALRDAAERIRREGGRAFHITADVRYEDEMLRLADLVVAEWGRIDTWVNNAGVSIYGTADAIPLERARQLFETNFWGVVHGSLAALPVLRERGGALINVGSVESDVPLPLQAYYAASKHAVKAFTDALRLELERAGAPVSVTLVKPASVATPLFEHAAVYMDREPVPPPPVYAPEVVAAAILAAAERPARDVLVGGGGPMLTALQQLAPGLADRVAERTLFDAQRGAPLAAPREGNLERPTADARERGPRAPRVRERSAWTRARLHPVSTVALALGVGLAVGGLAKLGSRG